MGYEGPDWLRINKTKGSEWFHGIEWNWRMDEVVRRWMDGKVSMAEARRRLKVSHNAIEARGRSLMRRAMKR